jgi:hypothetical protein
LFFVLGTLGLPIISLRTARVAATLIVGVLIRLAGLAVIVLIFNKSSGPFYRQRVATRGSPACSARPGRSCRLSCGEGALTAAARSPQPQIGLMVSHWKGRLPAIAPDRAALSMDR